ncbi:nucleobase:cation symporter-2 family protein [Sciscionella marina]|uniref:nucleobase:cation symporter-2 family protein n=1 Tax=Sciscionella marina TaxID=508770 RepID=UPI0003707FA1|nr:nucleobase:cation symporter-2 family protein [Sciscionella marina]
MSVQRGTRSAAERHPVDQVPPPWQLLAAGVQHVAAMYAGVVAPPLIIGGAVGLSPLELSLLIGASLFTAGIATMLQSLGVWRIGSRLPLVNGVSFATVAPVLAIAKQHGTQQALPIVYGATLIGGVFVVLAAPYFGKLTRLFPTVVSGTVITLIGLSLFPVSIGWISGTNASAPDYGAPRNILLAACTLVIVLLCNRFLRGFAQRISLLIGLAAGTLLAWPLGAVHASSLAQAPVFSLVTPLHFGAPQFDVAAIVSMLIVMLTVMTESTADMVALGEVVDRPAGEQTIAAGLRADGLATAVSAVFGGMACSAFAQNIGLIALTRIVSRYVVAVSGVILLLLGLFPVAGGVVALVPHPVLGGAGIALFGSVAVSGVKTLASADLTVPGNVLIVATSIGIGLIPIVAPGFYHRFPPMVQTVLGSGICAGAVVAVLLNLLLRGGKQRDPVTDS